jgi:hypothetical protein
MVNHHCGSFIQQEQTFIPIETSEALVLSPSKSMRPLKHPNGKVHVAQFSMSASKEDLIRVHQPRLLRASRTDSMSFDQSTHGMSTGCSNNSPAIQQVEPGIECFNNRYERKTNVR